MQAADPESRRRFRIWVFVILCICVVGFLFWLLSDESGPMPNTLTAEELEGGWRVLFDGQTTEGWQTKGDVSIRDGLLVLGDRRQTAEATHDVPVDEFDLLFEFQLEEGLDGQFCIRRDQGETGIGLGHLSLSPHIWNRASHQERAGKTFQEIIPKKRIFRLASFAGLGNIYGSGSWSPSRQVGIRFQVLTPGDRLVLRSIKFRPFSPNASVSHEKHD